MVEKTRRTGTRGPRGTTEPQWEVFVREREGDPMTHVGAIAAPDPEIAHEQASKLFSWYGRDIWVCPANAVTRFSAHEMAGSADDDGEIDGECENNGAIPAGENEPRVYEETEGTPNVRQG